MVGGFHHPVANNIRTYEIIRKITTGNWDDYITGIRRLVNRHSAACRITHTSRKIEKRSR